ncbi:LysE family translocator [Aurantiacibacter suaedae]|uniref:LysE family translocator n=1 Tax=Aurantiacibacter suaedae TaxID=2545755 RepID=UPI0019D5176D|nr:LysE family translocator [Aurantiacibacter suaedae]
MLFTPIELATFAGAATLLAFTPGPDLLFVLSEGMLRGRRAGLIGAVGLCSGLVFHIAAVTLGVAALIQSSPAAFVALRYIGAAYLVYLAWKAFTGRHAAHTREDNSPVALGGIYRRAVLMNVTNPKVAIFFLAFLPQFTHPERGEVVAQMLILGGVFMACALVSFAIVAVAAAPVGTWLRRSPSREVNLNIAAALIFVALAVKLIVG